jgi:hypothetical protein
MCVPGCQEAVRSALTRRVMLKGTGVLAACLPADLGARAQTPARRFSNVVDLTHTLSADFPTFFGARHRNAKTVRLRESWLQPVLVAHSRAWRHAF